ncbi:MAG: hypothetical protein DMF76_26115, partial [Acidobacteria bacterium]
NLFNPTNATIGRAQGVGTITNDDRRTVSMAFGQFSLPSVVEGNSGQRQAVFYVFLSAPANVDVTVQYSTQDRTATAGSDYVAASGTLIFPANSTTTTLSVSVPVLGDTDIEPHEFFELRLSNPTNADIERAIGVGTIINDDGPRTLSINDVAVTNDFPTAVFTVSLSAVSNDSVVFSYATADGTAKSGIDYRSFSSNNGSLPPGEYQTTFQIDIIADNNPLAVHEPRTFFVNLSNPVGATIADGQGVCTINDHIPTFCELNPHANGCQSPAEVDDCPITRASSNKGTINLSRQFRDEVLAQTPRGQKYTQAYYRFAGEVVELLVFNPRLLWRTSQALERYKPIMQTLVSRAEAPTESAQRAAISVSPQDLEAVDDLLKDIEAKASQQLRQTLAEIRSDLRDSQVQAEFGVKVGPGDSDLPSLPGDDGAKGPMRSVSTYPPNDSTMAARATEAYGNLPLRFEINQGQVAREVNFISRGNGYTLSLTNETAFQLRRVDVGPGFGEAVFNPQSDIRNPSSSLLRMKLLGSNPTPRVAGLDQLPTRSNYFIGSDARSWRTNISNFSKVQYEQIYPGVNLDYYGNQRQLEYDFTVTPGADPATIKLGIDGANKVEIDDQGDLVLHTTSGIVRQRRPLIYQEVDGIRQEICGGYALQKTQDIGFQSQGSYLVAFRVGAYDR